MALGFAGLDAVVMAGPGASGHGGQVCLEMSGAFAQGFMVSPIFLCQRPFGALMGNFALDIMARLWHKCLNRCLSLGLWSHLARGKPVANPLLKSPGVCFK